MARNTAALTIDLGWLFVMKTEKYKQKRTKSDTKNTNPLHPLPSPNSSPESSPEASPVQSPVYIFQLAVTVVTETRSWDPTYCSGHVRCVSNF